MLEITLDSQWYYSSNGKDYGPVSWSIIESMLQDDRLSPQDLVLQRGGTTYLRIEEVSHRMASQAMAAQKIVLPSDAITHQVVVSEPPPVPRDPAPVVIPAPWSDTAAIAPLAESVQVESDSGEYRMGEIPESPPLDPDAFLPKPVRSAKSAKQPKAAKIYEKAGPESDSDQDASASAAATSSRKQPSSEVSVAPQQLLFAIQVGFVWAISSSLLCVLGIQLGPWFQSIASLAGFLLLLLYYNVVAATVGYMLSLERERGRPVSSSTGTTFVLERAAPLVIGPLIVGVGAGSLIAVAFGLIHGLSHSASMGGILFLPAFLLIVGILFLAMFGSLIPVVMGLEDCSPSDALKICQERNQGSYARILLEYISVLSRIVPMMLLSLFVILAGLYGATALTVTPKILAEFKIGFSMFLSIISVFVVIGCWLAFVFVLLATHLATLYYDSQT